MKLFKHERVIQLIEDLDAIDAFDRITLATGICNKDVFDNYRVQDAKLQELKRLDADAYQCYILGDQAVLDKYYRKQKEGAL